jgi:hypothetical protein
MTFEFILFKINATVNVDIALLGDKTVNIGSSIPNKTPIHSTSRLLIPTRHPKGFLKKPSLVWSCRFES